MANKFDLKSKYQSTAANLTGTFNIGTLIPTGKTRFLTYIGIERAAGIAAGSAATTVNGVVASVAYSNASGANASAGALLPISLNGIINGSGGNVQPPTAFAKSYPDTPNIEHPLVSVVGGASSWMCVNIRSGGPAVRTFAQYYDE